MAENAINCLLGAPRAATGGPGRAVMLLRDGGLRGAGQRPAKIFLAFFSRRRREKFLGVTFLRQKLWLFAHASRQQ